MGSKRAINLLRKIHGDFVVENATFTSRNNYKYITATGNQDYSALAKGDHTIMVNVALANTNYIRLPEATTSNGGMKITVIFGLSPADNAYVGFVTSNIVGGATTISDASQGLSTQNAASQISAVGDANLRVLLDDNGSSDDGGGFPGTILEFWYTGVANVILYRGTLIGDVDSATIANHFETTAVNA